MPRKAKLTWQAGTKGRSGRWRKKYRGKVHYFPGGRGKSDRAAYDAAVEEWEKLKVRLSDDEMKLVRVAAAIEDQKPAIFARHAIVDAAGTAENVT